MMLIRSEARYHLNAKIALKTRLCWLISNSATKHAKQPPPTMSSYDDEAILKLVCLVRRKPNMTRKEFLAYHFQKHGRISDAAPDGQAPHKYRQYHIFDCAFGERPAPADADNAPPNRNHAWFWRDDVTELYFRDPDHLKKVFSSDYVRSKVGPDGLNFSDMETSIPWFGREHRVDLSTAAARSNPPSGDLEPDQRVALYFVSVLPGADTDLLAASFKKELERHAQDDARGLIVNTAIPGSGGFDPVQYFRGGDMPKYGVFFKVALQSTESAAAVRKAQLTFETQFAENLNTSESIIAFAKEALVHGPNAPFDAERQPKMEDL